MKAFVLLLALVGAFGVLAAAPANAQPFVNLHDDDGENAPPCYLVYFYRNGVLVGPNCMHPR